MKSMENENLGCMWFFSYMENGKYAKWSCIVEIDFVENYAIEHHYKMESLMVGAFSVENKYTELTCIA